MAQTDDITVGGASYSSYLQLVSAAEDLLRQSVVKTHLFTGERHGHLDRQVKSEGQVKVKVKVKSDSVE